MSQTERSKWRDDFFPSQWHRVPRLPQEMLFTDIDGVEWRKNGNGFYEPAGFFEYKLMHKFEEVMAHIEKENRLHWQLSFIRTLSKPFNVGAYFIGYSYGGYNEISEVRMFNVNKWRKNEKPVVNLMSEGEFKEFIMML